MVIMWDWWTMTIYTYRHGKWWWCHIYGHFRILESLSQKLNVYNLVLAVKRNRWLSCWNVYLIYHEACVWSLVRYVCGFLVWYGWKKNPTLYITWQQLRQLQFAIIPQTRTTSLLHQHLKQMQSVTFGLLYLCSDIFGLLYLCSVTFRLLYV